MHKELAGKILNNLIFLKPSGETTRSGKHKIWECLCTDCGTKHLIPSERYNKGVTKCKCLRNIKSGDVFGKLTVINPLSKSEVQGKFCICLCNCGTKTEITIHQLVNHKVKSCGCLLKSGNPTHNMSKTPEYRSWQKLKERCYNKNCKNYKYYGGRGIQVCESWLESFENFYKDMGDKPSPKELYSLDRIDVEGNYTLENCRWTTKNIQNSNQRGKTGYIGVKTKGQRFISRLTAHGEYYYLGSFKTAKEAASAYDDKYFDIYKDRPNGT